jgi:integrase
MGVTTNVRLDRGRGNPSHGHRNRLRHSLNLNMKHVTEISMPEPEAQSGNIRTGIGGPSSGGDLARKRYQRGALRRERHLWILRWREDVLNEAGEVIRVERRARVGPTEDLPTKALARRVADRLIQHVNEPNYMPGKVATVQEFSEVYSASVCPTLKPSSCAAARSLCRIYINPVLGHYRLDQIKGEVPQLLVNDLRRRGLSRKTILNALSTLASMLGAARDWNYLASKLDWQKLRLPVEELQQPQRFFTPDESQRIIDAAPEPWNINFAFNAYLGLRAGEAMAVTWENIDLTTGALRVNQSNWCGKLLTVKSKSSNRDLPLPPVLVDMLKAYRLRWRPNAFGLLFANAKGQPITSCYVRRDILHPIRERLGIPRGGFHAFRHGLGTALMQAGASARVVQQQLGHSDLRMLARYAHVVPQDQRTAVDRTVEMFLRRSAANSDVKSLRIN